MIRTLVAGQKLFTSWVNCVTFNIYASVWNRTQTTWKTFCNNIIIFTHTVMQYELYREISKHESEHYENITGGLPSSTYTPNKPAK